MEKLKVLFLTYAYPPQKHPRSVQISHLVGFLRNEYDLKVITYPTAERGDQSLLNFTCLDNVEYAHKSRVTRLVEESKGYRIKKAILPDFHYLWHFDLYHKAKKIIEECGAHIIVTFGQPMSTHIAGLKLKERYPHLKWLAHFSDPWVDNLFNDYNAWTKFINTYYQNAVFKSADKLIFTSQETITAVTRNYSLDVRAKTLHLPHIFNKNLYPQTQSVDVARNLIKLRYIGNFYGTRQPDSLFAALQYLPQEQLQGIRVELIGSATQAVNEKIKHYKLEKIVVTKPPVSYLESLALMQATDLLLIIDAPTDMSPFLPSKLIDYIGANKPIFGITPPGTSQKLIEEMGYCIADPSNPEEIARKLAITIQNIRDRTTASIPEHIQQRYSVEAVGTQMKKILEDTLGGSHASHSHHHFS